MPRLEREDVEVLVADYAWALDSTRPDEFAALFTRDGVLDSPAGVFEGIDALAEFAGRAALAERGWRHWASNIRIVESSGEEARVRSYVAVVDTRQEPPAVVAAGTYEDELRYAEGRWRIHARRWR